MTRFSQMIPMLAVADVRRSVDFYTKALGFKMVSEFRNDEGTFCWAHVLCDGVSLMLTIEGEFSVDDGVKAARGSVMLYFYPDDVVELHASLQSRGFKPSRLSVRFYRMREFTMTDPDGYTLMFGQQTTDPPTPQDCD